MVHWPYYGYICISFSSGGALKPTDVDTLWVHVTCAWFQPEVSFASDEKMEPALGILSIPSNSFVKVKCFEYYIKFFSLMEPAHLYSVIKPMPLWKTNPNLLPVLLNKEIKNYFEKHFLFDDRRETSGLCLQTIHIVNYLFKKYMRA